MAAKTVQEIEIEMRQVRRELDNQADELVDNARQITEQMTDWRSYVGAHPWIFLGAAAALGYLIVPTRVTVDRPVAETLVDLAKQGAIKMDPPMEETSLLAQAGKMGLGIASSAAMQFGMGLLNRMVNQYLAPNTGTMTAGPRGPGRPAGYSTPRPQ